MKLESGGAAQKELQDADDDVRSNIPRDASCVAFSEALSDAPSDALNNASSDTTSGTLRNDPEEVRSVVPKDASSNASNDAPKEATSDASKDAPSDAPNNAPNDESGEVPSNTPSNVASTIPNGDSSDSSSESSRNSSSNTLIDASSNVHNSSAMPSDGTAFHFQMAETEAEAEAAGDEPRGPRGLLGRLLGCQCDMRAWSAAFVVAALLFVVLVVSTSFAFTDFTDIGDDARNGMEHTPQTISPLAPIGP